MIQGVEDRGEVEGMVVVVVVRGGGAMALPHTKAALK